MIVLDFTHNNYSALIQNLAAQFKVDIQNNEIEIPKDIGTGKIKIIQLPNGLQALMAKISFKKEVLVKSGNIAEGDYILNFDEKEIRSKTSINVNSFVRLTGESFKHLEVFKPGSSLQYLKILFSKNWLSNYIGLSKKMSLFEKYVPNKSEAGEKEKLNDEYKSIINEMWNASEEFMQHIFYHNRILLLIEKFFTRIHDAMLNSSGTYKLTASEVLNLKKVENKLHVFKTTPPTIVELASICAVSTVRLSQSFKQVYGTSIYNYYQRQRMKKGYELLETKKLSVKEVSDQLGYTNLSNFVLAFTKQFGISPKSLLE